MQKEDTGKEAGVCNQTKNQTKPFKNLDAALKEDSYKKLDKEVIKTMKNLRWNNN